MSAPELASAPETVAVRGRPWAARIRLVWALIWKYAVGVVFCQSILGSVMIIGWTYRAMRRASLKAWWKASPQSALHPNFRAWTDTNPGAAAQRTWPNWFVEQNAGAAWIQSRALPAGARWRTRLALPFRSLWQNFKLGIQGAFNTAVLTVPAGLLWLFAWYDGWNNSFAKGYEQAAVGPLVGVLGILLFIAAMVYVPWAQARQAVTGQWKSFYQFGLIWSLVRRHWPAGLFLAALYSLCLVPVGILKTGVMFAPINNPAIEHFTDAQALEYLNGYFLRSAGAVFVLYLLTKWAAARLYARAILQGLQRGLIPVHQLAPIEREHLQLLELIQIDPPRSRHVLARVAAGTGAGLARTAGLGAVCLVWFTFAAQIYISEFLKYNPIIGWLNQPLIQLPWFRYIPPHLENQGQELGLLLLALVLVGIVLWIRRKLSRRSGLGTNENPCLPATRLPAGPA